MFTNTTTFIVYIFAMIVIGIVAARSTSSLNDYVLGGRRLGRVITGLSAGASDMSGWLLMGLPGALYVAGLSQAWIAIGLTVGQWCNWKFVAARLRSFTQNASDALTLPDYFAARFKDKYRVTAIVAAVIILIFFVVYCASGMVSGARLFEQTFGLDYRNALLIGAVSTILYVCIGGFLAISWTDTFQAGLMIFALLLTPIVTYLAIGDTTQFVTLIETARPHAFNIISDLSVVAVLSSMAWGLGYFGQPHILVRFMAADSVKSIPAARRIGMTWMISCLVGAVGAGFFGIAYFQQHPELAGVVSKNPETVFMELTKILFNPWIVGIILAAILAAVMSTLSCQLLVCSSALTEDLYKGFIRKNASQKELVWVGRIMVLAIAVLAIVLAGNPDSKVLGLVAYAWAGFGAAFGPTVLISVFWKKMSLAGAICGMITGAVTVIVWEMGNFFELYSLVPGFIFSAIVIYVVSLLTQKVNAPVESLFNDLERQFWVEVKDH